MDHNRGHSNGGPGIGCAPRPREALLPGPLCVLRGELAVVQLTIEDCDTIMSGLNLLLARVDACDYGDGDKTEEQRRALYRVRQNRKTCIGETQSKVREIRRGLRDR